MALRRGAFNSASASRGGASTRLRRTQDYRYVKSEVDAGRQMTMDIFCRPGADGTLTNVLTLKRKRKVPPVDPDGSSNKRAVGNG